MARWSAAEALRRVAWMLALAAALAPGGALAASCTVTTLPANFGTYDPLRPAAAATTGQVTVACTCSGVDCVVLAYRIDIAAGSSASTADRAMRGDGGSLHYNLYADPTYATPWGTGAAGVSTLYLVALFGAYQALPVYARMPARQIVGAGSYVDAPAVTIVY